MTNDYKPGCFGSPLCHAHNALPCARCPFEADCGNQAERMAARLREAYGINAVTGARRPARPATRPAAVASGCGEITVSADSGSLPKKARELVESWSNRGIDVKRAVAMRANPWALSPPKYLRAAVQSLIEGGFTKHDLRRVFINEFGWSDATASSHVGFVVPALIAAGAAKEEEGRVIPVTE